MDSLLFYLILFLIAGFTLSSGFFNGGGIVSTVITTRTLEPLPALILVALCQIGGVFLLGQAVVQTIGLRMMTFTSSSAPDERLWVLVSALAGASCWNGLMWSLSLPSSSNHSLLGGLMGAAHTFASASVVWPVMWKILIGLALVPIAAALLSIVISRALFWLGQRMNPSASIFLKRMQIASLVGLAMASGSNDGQKSIALVLLALLALGGTAVSAGNIPLWVGLVCGVFLGLGTILGSRRTVETVGKGLCRLTPWQGLCSQVSAMVLVGGSSFAGFPMATSHVMSSTIIGAGAAVHPGGVRWGLVGSIGLAWLLTIPAAALVASLFSHVVSKAF